MSRQWRRIEDYEVDSATLSNKELAALSGIWIDRRATMADSQGMARFIERLKREWAIETGLIERLYTLDRGITELLIEHGINTALVPHRNGDKSAAQITAMIGDQQDAIESIFSFVKGDRTLSTSYVKELHSLFTRNQEFVEARDQFGQKISVPLIHGDYKKLPNNPTRRDGSVHHYCPPEHVAAEMDHLIELHSGHVGVAPEVEAAWLHHRFTQIHPFQDGNGRIARALATLVFVKANWLPLVVQDRDRKTYVDALESADDGDLKPLISFFCSRQKAEFLRAFGIARDTGRALRVEVRIDSIKQRLAQRQDSLEKEWQAAVPIAERLHTLTRERLDHVAASLDEAMRNYEGFDCFVDDEKDQDSRSHYFGRQIVYSAKTLGYYANLQHYRSWIRFVAKDENHSNILISFHCIGRGFQGILVCSGTWFSRTLTDDGSCETGGENTLSDEVFQFNYKESFEDVEMRFHDWLEGVIERGLALWEAAL